MNQIDHFSDISEDGFDSPGPLTQFDGKFVHHMKFDKCMNTYTCLYKSSTIYCIVVSLAYPIGYTYSRYILFTFNDVLLHDHVYI